MKLKKLLNAIDFIEIKGNYDKQMDIKDICYHTDDVTEDAIYVAIKGFKTDGHKYIKKALEKGANIVVVEEYTDDDCVQIKVKDSREALADLSYRFFDEPSGDLNIIGITASNGKTTTAFMTKSILDYNNKNNAICGTVELKYGDVFIPSILTTPESRELQYHLRNMTNQDIDTLIMEVSSAGEYLSRVRNVHYDIVTFNNFTPEHLDMHGDVENYFLEKKKLITQANPDAYAILNMDDERIASLKSQTRAKVIGYSFENDTQDISIKNIDLSTGFGEFELVINNEIKADNFVIKPQTLKIALNVGGYSSVMNSVPAAMSGLLMGFSAENVIKGIEQFRGVERRFEIIYDREFKIIDDHYANKKNINVTLNTLDRMDYKNLVLLYAIRGNRGVDVNRESAEETVNWYDKINVKKFIVTSSTDVVGDKDTVSQAEFDIFNEVMDKAEIEREFYDTLEESINQALKYIEAGDVLLLAGCQGMDKAARIILHKLAEGKDEETKTEILKPLETRVC